MKEDISHLLEKSVITGVATAGVSTAFHGISAQYKLPGSNKLIPFLPLAFILGGANSAIVDALHLGINKAIPIPQKPKDMASFLGGAALSAGSFYLLLNLGGRNLPGQYSLWKALVTGAVGEIVGAGVYNQLKENLYL